MKHKIEITYDTGNSFKTERNVKKILDIEFDFLDVAKENLRRIKEHYLFYNEIDNNYSSHKSDALVRKKMESQRWGVKGDAESCIKLLTDSGETWQIYTFWNGYFEHLKSVKIISPDNDMEFETENL